MSNNPPGWHKPRPVRCPCDSCADRELCDHHRQSTARMAGHGHVDLEAAQRAACDLAHQCPECKAGTP